MPTRTNGRAFLSDPKQCVWAFSLPKASSLCFATLLNIVFSSFRFLSFFFLLTLRSLSLCLDYFDPFQYC